MGDDILTIPPAPSDRRVSYGAAPSQFGELRVPRDAPRGAVVVLHGGFWRARYSLDHLGHLCAAITARGYATWSLEYRRLGEEGGGFPGTCDDVVAGAHHARTLDLPWPPVLLGHSAGGHLALWAAARGRVPCRGVVALAPVSDLREARRLELSHRVVSEFLPDGNYSAASPVEMLPLGARQVIVHGTADDTVPVEMSRDYAKRASAAGDDVKLVELPAMGHFEPVDPRTSAFASVLAEIRALHEVGT